MKNVEKVAFMKKNRENEKFQEIIALAVEAIKELNAAIDRHQKERLSWVQKNERIKPLLIDKRRKVHRCRNNC